jgi:hypothetical protein
MTHNIGVTGKTTVGTGMFYAPYMPDGDAMFYGRAKWKLKFALWPRRCEISKQRIWLTHGYEGTAMWSGPGDPVYEYKWHSKTEHIIYQLKRQYGN